VNVRRSEAVRTRIFWQMLIQFFLISACINGTVAHLSALLTDRGMQVQAAAFAISLFGGAAFAGRIVTGYFVDRFFAPHVIAVLFSGAAVALLLLARGSTGDVAYLAALLMGMGAGAEADVMPYLVSRPGDFVNTDALLRIGISPAKRFC
jgi:predicted MFS family arabinose efflux permease